MSMKIRCIAWWPAVACVLLATAPGAVAAAGDEGLTIERMYSDPRLAGVAPRGVAWSPDGKRLAFLWNDEGTMFYDIWLYDVGAKRLRRASHAAAIGGSSKPVLTRAEIDRLETLRRSGNGIHSFRWSPDGKRILFPLGGDLFVLDTGSDGVKRLFRTAASETDAKFSPDGTRIAFVRDNDLWMLDLASGTTVQLTDTGSETLYNGLGDYVDYEEVGRDEAFWWSPDGSRIAYVQVDVSTIRELLIPDYLGTFVEVRRQLRPVAGGANGVKRLGVLNVESRETVWVEPGVPRDEYIVQVHWHPGGDALLVLSEPRHLRQLHFLKADPGDGSVDTLFTVGDDAWVNISNTWVLWDEGGSRLCFTSEEDGWNHIYRMDWESGHRERLTSGEWEVTGLHLVDRAGRIWYTSTEVEPQQRHLYRVDGSGKRQRVSPGAGWYGCVLPAGAGAAALVYSNPAVPPDLYVLKPLKGIQTEEEGVLPNVGPRGGGHVPPPAVGREWPVPEGLVRVTRSPAPGFSDLHLCAPRYLTLRSRLDGETVHALLVMPPGLEGVDLDGIRPGRSVGGSEQRYPAIISVHGGGYAQSVYKGWRWNALFNTYLAQRGYVILDLDYRGSSGYGRKFRTDVHLDIGGSDLEDVMTGHEFVSGLPFVDSTRVGIWGWSYGGYMTTLALLKYPDAFYAGAAVAPVNDWRNYDTHYTEERLGSPCEQTEAYRAGSPITYASGLRNHLLMIHGMSDDNVHFQDTVQLVEALIGTGVDFEVMFYPSGKHGIRADASRIHLFRKMVRHFDRFLQGKPDAVCP